MRELVAGHRNVSLPCMRDTHVAQSGPELHHLLVQDSRRLAFADFTKRWPRAEQHARAVGGRTCIKQVALGVADHAAAWIQYIHESWRQWFRGNLVTRHRQHAPRQKG